MYTQQQQKHKREKKPEKNIHTETDFNTKPFLVF